MKHVAIIGGGLGGLAVALRLRARGFSVSLFEAGPTLGGKMNRWAAEGFTFDTGPSLITMPWVFEDLFHAAGARMQDHVELLPLHPLSEYVYEDGTRFTYTSSLPEWLGTVKQIEPRDVEGFLRFQALGARLFEVSKRTFLKRSPYEKPDWQALRSLRHMPVRYGWGNYHDTVAAHFRSPYLQQLFDRYPTYVGSSPYRAPATLALIPYLEFAFGGYAVRGGLYTIAKALAELCERNGVRLCVNSPVDRIETDATTAKAVILRSGQRVPADFVVMNGDSTNLPGLLGNKAVPDARSMSGFVMLMGVKQSLPSIAQHTIFFSSDYHREFDEIFDQERFPTEPTVYVNAASRADRQLVPGEGEGEALFIMANSPAIGGKWTEPDTVIARERVLARLRRGGFPAIEGTTVVKDTWTPKRIEDRYLMPGGAIYGSDSHGWRNAFFRPANRDKKIRNLFRVGGSTHPGGGTPTVLLSAEITCRLIS